MTKHYVMHAGLHNELLWNRAHTNTLNSSFSLVFTDSIKPYEI